MPTQEEAPTELERVFDMIAAEYGEQGISPADSTSIVNASSARGDRFTISRQPTHQLRGSADPG
jgi:hypothetical protein